jgi:uncharacterized protein
MRVVFDTNVLLDALQDDFSASARLVDAVVQGDIDALITPAVRKEYTAIAKRWAEQEEAGRLIEEFVEHAHEVSGTRVEEATDDPEDIKFLQAAVGGDADAIVTSDRHLLDVGSVNGVRIMTPQELWTVFEEETGGSSNWEQFARGIGIGDS